MRRTLAILAAATTLAAASPTASATPESVRTASATPEGGRLTWAAPKGGRTASAAPESGRLTWVACSDAELPAPMECASLDVPVNWAEPGGRKIRLDLVRLPATEPARRIGSVLGVPGGPGNSGIDDLKQAAPNLRELGRRFDLVGYKPRSTVWHTSMPAICEKPGTTLEDPRGRKRFTAQAAAMTKAFHACRRADPTGLFAHLDALSAARDMEAIRAALGEERLSFMANSYGGVTSIAYARLFPQRIRALYVDGVINHAAGWNDQILRVSVVFERKFREFTGWCATTPACALHGEDAGVVWRALVRAADREPIPVTSPEFGKGELTGWHLRQFTFSADPGPDNANWLAFAESVDKARRGDGSGFGAWALGNARVWAMPGVLAMTCADGRGFADHAELRTYRRAAEKAMPNLGSARFDGLACTGWPLKVANPSRPLLPDGLPPILGAGSTYGDLVATESFTRMIPGSVSVIYEGPGHSLYLMGKKCPIRHATAYLTELKLPAPGTTCPAE
ncbi:alpha/beta fold hydrolase [Nonomuraea endophytica]|uniref:alpha/beta fold hydrolase n=1 Tax=Nonomuraea endophytica TaxID=714136 RepID=UPI0037CB8849